MNMTVMVMMMNSLLSSPFENVPSVRRPDEVKGEMDQTSSSSRLPSVTLKLRTESERCFVLVIKEPL